MKKNYILFIFLLIMIFSIFSFKNKRTILDDNTNYNQSGSFGDIGGGILFAANVINFGSTNMSSKNVQNAISELYQAIYDGCKIGYIKGTSTNSMYTCNKSSAGTSQSLVFDSEDVNYDNTSSGLVATNVQNAIIELSNQIPNCLSDYSQINVTSNSYDCGRRLTITANAQTVTYGTAISSAISQVTVADLPSGYSLQSITLTPSTTNVTLSGTITPSSAVIYDENNNNVSSNFVIQYNTGVLTINKRTVTITAPAVNSSTLTYSGSAQTLFTSAGSCSTGGTMYWYSAPATTSTAPTFSTSTWTTTSPDRTATNAGTYYYYYYCRVTDTDNNTGTGINTVKSVSKAIGTASMTGGSVAISGTNTWGSTLTATITAPSPAPDSYTCTWYSNSSNSTSGGTSLGTATVSSNKCTYSIAKAQVGKYIYVTITAQKSNYSNRSFSDITDASANTTATVAKKTLSVTATNYNSAYDGSAHGATVKVTNSDWDGKTIVSGTSTSYGTTVTSTGAYNTTYTIKPTYTAYTNGAKTVYYKITGGSYYKDYTGSATVNITKATPTMSISPTSGTIACGGTKTTTVTTNGDGAISCTTSSSSIATCSVSNKTVTIIGVAGGSATITVKQAAGTNYNAASNKTYSATVNSCATWHWEEGTNYSSTACPMYCPSQCTTSHGSSAQWTCHNYNISNAPTEAGQSNGRYCWCKY